MNYTSRKLHRKVCEATDSCGHMEIGESAPLTLMEEDSFGIVAAFAMCDACAETFLNSETNCPGCGTLTTEGDIKEWAPYDWDRRNDGNGIMTCSTCRASQKHKERVQRDRMNYEAEFGVDDWDY